MGLSFCTYTFQDIAQKWNLVTFQEKIGDLLFFQNELIGILIEECDESTIVHKYLDVDCLCEIHNILKHLSPRKGDRNFTVNNRF